MTTAAPFRSGADAEVGLCLLLAAADGEISDAELAAFTTRVGRLLGDDFPLFDLGAMVEAELSRISELGADAYVAEIATRIAEDRRVAALRHACEVACADGLSPEEEDMLRAAGRALDVDVEPIIGGVGHKKTDFAPAKDDDHEDPPDARTEIVEARLVAAGWGDPHAELRAAGIDLGRIGALAIQYRSARGVVLDVEHHTCDGTLRLHVSHDASPATAFILHPEGREAELVDALVAMQDELAPENVVARVTTLGKLGRVQALRDGEIEDLA